MTLWLGAALGAVFLLGLLATDQSDLISRWGLVPATVWSGLDALSPLTLLSAMWLHVGWTHLLRNAVYLAVFGWLVEQWIGGRRLLGIYLAAGMVASAGHLVGAADSSAPAVGASGAIAGVMGAYVALRARHGKLARTRPWVDTLATMLLAVWGLSLTSAAVLHLAREQASFSWLSHATGLGAGAILLCLARAIAPKSSYAWPGADAVWPKRSSALNRL
ncbi:MAG: rhomboid family intramembrane serine protease [Chloroflexota bacterium]